jgi:hypothetical protein
MKYLLASLVAAAAVAASTAAIADTSGGGDAPKESCAIGSVTGIGGTEQSMHEYLSASDRDKYRYLTDHPLRCQVSDEGRTSGCTGITSLRHERVSVYDDSDSTLMTVVARVELDQGTYPVIIVVSKKDVQCEQ